MRQVMFAELATCAMLHAHAHPCQNGGACTFYARAPAHTQACAIAHPRTPLPGCVLPVQVTRHPNFRLIAAMNPATDAGKRELPAPLRNRFTEIWVPEPSQK